jgi:predicted Zn-dependent protease
MTIRTVPARSSARQRLLACVVLAACTACAVSQQQEVQLGASTAAQIDTMLPLIHDQAVSSYINLLGNQLARATDTRDLAWHFTVVDSKEVNAFALPGGWIYVNRGLIERAENMSEVAGVLGHEIGHVTRRHTVQQMQQQQEVGGAAVLLCTLTKVCESSAGGAAVNVAGSALFAKFSRADEAEADAEGVKTTVKAGIDPNGIPAMFRILLDERKSNPSAVDAFFASHPLEEDRIAATRTQIAKYSPGALKGLIRDTPQFQSFKRRLQSLPPSPTPKGT